MTTILFYSPHGYILKQIETEQFSYVYSAVNRQTGRFIAFKNLHTQWFYAHIFL
ncbi:hypothetical protein [cyanobacterium endosymbiont of Epithemia turgida]|uniref:hypothetical protein n=1 Tax=cyanobacterium endosymbiont of Epithemia turgida TaxID=718217 RepID=UPI00149421DA|nr:hypothetical protein [cyanobacterium endosymbiont of Epithemia turgida]